VIKSGRYPLVRIACAPLLLSLGLLHAQCVQTVPLAGTYSIGGATTGTGNGPFTLTATNSTFSFVELVPNQTFTFAQLTSLFANFTSNSGGSGGGTPRFAVGVNDGGTERFITIDLGNSPAFTDSDTVLNTYSGFNVIGNNDAGRYQTGPGGSGFPGGSPFTTYSGSATSALTLAGPLQVEEIDYITDTFSPFPSRDETLFSIGGSVTVPCPADGFQVGYAANVGPAGGESFIDMTNTGAGSTATTPQNLCINVYAFDAQEELLTCCACKVTPNGLSSLNVRQDLLSNTSTGENPSSAVIKLLATAPAGGICDATSAGTGANPLAAGMAAWGTTLHTLAGSPTGFGLTERPFTISTLSAGELSHLATFCSFVVANGTGSGICKGCSSPSGLGAASSQ
jgi:hypothetical protein